MTRSDLIICMLSGALLVGTSWPGSARPIPSDLAPWAPPADDRSCGAAVEVVALLPDPTRQLDRVGEVVWLRNLEPTPIVLEGWRLASRRASVDLGRRVLGPGERAALTAPELGAIRLANHGGTVQVRDPCGITTAFAWSESEPGQAVRRPNERAPPPPWSEEDPMLGEVPRQ